MAQPVALTKALIAAVANNIAHVQSLSAAGDLTLTGTTVTLDTQRRVLVTFGSDESGKTYSIYGYNDSGGAIREDIAGTTAGTVATNFDFLTITRIHGAAASAGNITVGTNGVGATRWVQFNPHLSPPSDGISVALVSGSGNVGIQYTYDEFLTASVAAALNNMDAMTAPTPIDHPLLQGLTTSADGNIDKTVNAWRLIVNSGTGTWKATGIQAGISGP